MTLLDTIYLWKGKHRKEKYYFTEPTSFKINHNELFKDLNFTYTTNDNLFSPRTLDFYNLFGRLPTTTKVLTIKNVK